MKKVLLLIAGLLSGGLFCAAGDHFDQSPLDRFPARWRPYQKITPENGSVLVVPDGKGRAVKIVTKGIKGANAVGMTREFYGRALQKYQVSVTFRHVPGTSGGKGVFNLVFRTRSGKYFPVGKSQIARVKPGDPVTLTIQAQAPEDTAVLLVELHTGWNTPGAVLVDDLKIEYLTPEGLPFSRFGKQDIQLRELYLETPLVRAGRPQAAIVAGTPEQKKIASRLNEVIRAKTGQTLPVLPPERYTTGRKLDRHLLMIGNCDDNRAVEALYMQRLVILDSRYPGKGGWNVRTLHDAYGDGHNVVFVGGSDETGHRAAAEELIKCLKTLKPGQELTLPRLARIHYPKGAGIKLGWGCEWDGFFGYDPISRNLAAYYMTGDRKYADEALRLFFPDAEQIRRNNRMDRYDDGAEPIAKPYHYWGSNMILYWDLVEEDPVFDRVRLAVTRKFYQQMQYWIQSGYGGWYRIYLNPRDHRKLGDRHYMMEALCVYTVARYFDKYYPGPDSAEGLRCVRRVFAPVWNAFTPAGGWRAWFPSMIFPALQYAMMEDFQQCRTNPCIRRYGEMMLLISSLRPGEWLNGLPGIYGMLARALDDEAFAVMQSRFIRDPEAPLLGQSYFTPGRVFSNNTLRRTAGKVIRTHVTASAMNYTGLPAGMKTEDVDEFYAWRSQPDECGDYLLVAPKYRSGGRADFYNFSLDELMLNGQAVLSGNNQLYPAANALASGKNAWYAQMRHAVRLQEAVFFDGAVPDFNGHHWERVILYLKGRGVLFFDRLRAAEDNLLYLENTLRPAPFTRAEITPAGDLQISNHGALPPPGPDTLVRVDGKQLFASSFEGEKAYNEFLGATAFRKWPENGTVQFRFTAVRSGAAALKFHFLQDEKSSGELTLKLDGRTLKTCRLLPPEPGQPLEFTVHSAKMDDLSAGEHTIELVLKGKEDRLLQWAGLSATVSGKEVPDGTFTAGCGLPAELRVTQIPLSDPGIGLPVKGNSAQFVLKRNVKKGEVLDMVSLIRPGKSTGPVAATAPDGKTALRLPGSALLVRHEKGFILKEKDRWTGWNVQEIPGLFKQPGPVLFEYSIPDRRLTLCGKNGNVFALPVPADWPRPSWDRTEQEIRRIFAAVEKSPPKPVINAPQILPAKEIPLEAPAGLLCRAGDFLAAASGKTLTLYGADGQKKWSAVRGDEIGALHYWPKTGLIVCADRGEGITAYTLDGQKRWQTRSESAEGLIKSNKIYWFKSAYPGVYSLTDAELIPGRPRLFAGSTGTVEVFTPEGVRESAFWHEYGPVGSLAVLPAEDGHEAEVFAARDFGAWPTVWGVRAEEGKLVTGNRWMIEDHRGSLMNQYGFSGVGKTFLQSIRFAPGEPARLMGVFEGAQNRLAVWDFRGKVLAGADLGSGSIASPREYAVPARSLRNVRGFCALTSPRGKTVFGAATGKQLFFLFDRDLRLKKLIELSGEPVFAHPLPGRQLFAVGLPGEVWLITPDGNVQQRLKTPGTPVAIQEHARQLWVGTGGGLAVFDR